MVAPGICHVKARLVDLIGSSRIENATSAQPKNLASAPRLSPLPFLGGVAGDETMLERLMERLIEGSYSRLVVGGGCSHMLVVGVGCRGEGGGGGLHACWSSCERFLWLVIVPLNQAVLDLFLPHFILPTPFSSSLPPPPPPPPPPRWS